MTAWTRCPESAAAAPGWACVQLFKQVITAGVLDEDAVRRAADLADAGQPAPGLIDPGAERFEFHSAAAASLRSTTRPLLLVVDDLQWADPSSLRLLEFLVGELRTMPVLLVVTVRPLTPEPPAALVACLSEMARHSTVRRLDLEGLPTSGVRLWLDRRSPGAVDPAVVELVHERTNGNPFFIGEVVELLAARQGLADVDRARELGAPAAVQDVVRRRIDVLPSETQKLLSTAAVQGGTIDVDLLAHVAAQSVPATVEALDPAVEAGLLIEDRLSPGQLRFTHALVGEALVTALTMSKRARLHAATVDALEDLRPRDADEHLARLAYHAAQGAVAGTGPQAVDYASRAARRATEQRQHEEAVAYWEQALRALDLARPANREERLDLLIELGSSRSRTGDFTGTHETVLEALSLATALGDTAAKQSVAALLPTPSLWAPSPYGRTNPELVGALGRVLAGMDEAPTARRAEILGGLADLVHYTDPAQADSWSTGAVEVARQVNDAPTASWRPTSPLWPTTRATWPAFRRRCSRSKTSSVRERASCRPGCWSRADSSTRPGRYSGRSDLPPTCRETGRG